MKSGFALATVALATVAPLSQAAAQITQTVTVHATDDIYRTNQGNATGLDGTDPIAISLGNATSITFSVVANGVTVNNGTGNTLNDADGIGNSNPETNSGYQFLSGIKAPNAGFLAGLIITPASATLVAQQTALDFTGAGATSFTSLSPKSSQVFFIGDGLTGDATGTTQTFIVPTSFGNAGKTLYLGLTDACGYSGSPSCYSDNLGTFTVTYTLNGVTAAVPESATWAMMIAGFGLVGFALRRRVRASEAAFDAKIKRMTAGEIA